MINVVRAVSWAAKRQWCLGSFDWELSRVTVRAQPSMNTFGIVARGDKAIDLRLAN